MAKEKVLEYLEYPLAPLPVTIESVRSENELLSELLT
jgi:hypothetical protein